MRQHGFAEGTQNVLEIFKNLFQEVLKSSETPAGEAKKKGRLSSRPLLYGVCRTG
jgi:hypothetical protein